MKFLQRTSELYATNEFRQLRNALIDERKNAEGLLICGHCGKPILKKYDCIAHHIKPLNAHNVNDIEVSLNPANIQLVHAKCHNEIHSRFGYATERKVYYVYGAPCSGKTTFVNEVKGNSDLIVDMDNIWECITGRRYDKPKALNTNAFMLRDCLLDMVRTRAGKWERAYIIDGGAVKSDRERKLALYGAEAIHIGTDRDECLKRLYASCNRTNDQKKEWERYIDRWFNDYVPD